jgi:hypothetical protein
MAEPDAGTGRTMDPLSSISADMPKGADFFRAY